MEERVEWHLPAETGTTGKLIAISKQPPLHFCVTVRTWCEGMFFCILPKHAPLTILVCNCLKRIFLWYCYYSKLWQAMILSMINTPERGGFRRIQFCWARGHHDWQSATTMIAHSSKLTTALKCGCLHEFTNFSANEAHWQFDQSHFVWHVLATIKALW